LVERQYYFSLALLDEAVESIYDALDASGQLDNTYFIFASDNGGCPEGGGRNGGLRGGKGSLFEGGTKVNAIIAGGLVPEAVRNSNFLGLFHVSDWFPTILSMAGITGFEAKFGYELDGVDQYDAMFNGADNPRSLLLYNYYTNVQFAKKLDLWTSGGAAIRNTKYKLMHGYGASLNSQWYSTDVVFNGDDALDKPGACTQDSAWEGQLEPMLFDLLSDPSETQNIYYSMLNEVVKAKVKLCSIM
jgi:arylsulfatase A-like enzyme